MQKLTEHGARSTRSVAAPLCAWILVSVKKSGESAADIWTIVSFLDKVAKLASLARANQAVAYHLWAMARRRGNRKSASGQHTPTTSYLATAFQEQVRKRGLNTQTCVASEELRRWCERNKNHCYIPERLLERWGIVV